MNANGRTVLITGASTGIGRACALQLARIGYRVFAGVRRGEDGESLEKESGGAIKHLIFDVTDAGAVRKAVKTMAAELPARNESGDVGLDALVNNAGIAVPGPIEFLGAEDFQRQMAVNVNGQLTVIQECLPLLRASQGRIINISSVSGRLSVPLVGAYGASKFALEALSDSLRMEVRRWGIRVSVIQPGAVDTPIWDKGTQVANEYERNLPERAHELYGDAIRAIRKVSQQSHSRAVSPDKVVKAVLRALTARSPRTRYLVGMDARIQAFMRKILPDKLLDAVLLRMMGLPR